MKMDLFLVLSLILSHSTFTCAQNEPDDMPLYIVKIWTKSYLIALNYPRHFCSGVLIKQNFLIAGRECITKYSKNHDPKVFVITAGPETYRPFFNGATINHCKEIFTEEQFLGNKKAITKTSIYIVTVSPFFIDSRIQVAPLNTKVLQLYDSCPVHMFINRTGIAGLVMRNYIAKIKSNKDCSNRCYTVDITNRIKNVKADFHLATYFICNGTLAGVTFGPYEGITNESTIYRSDNYRFIQPYLSSMDDSDDKAEKMNPIVLIMFLFMNVLLIILN